MPSPFNNVKKNRDKKKKPMGTQSLAEVDLGTIRKGSNRSYTSSGPRIIGNNFKSTSYQTTLPKAPQVKKMSLKPNYPEPAKQIKVDYIPPRPVRRPTRQSYDNVVKQPTKLNPIIEAYTPPQFEGAEPLAQTQQKKIYSTFKQQMQQLKNR